MFIPVGECCFKFENLGRDDADGATIGELILHVFHRKHRMSHVHISYSVTKVEKKIVNTLGKSFQYILLGRSFTIITFTYFISSRLSIHWHASAMPKLVSFIEHFYCIQSVDHFHPD